MTSTGGFLWWAIATPPGSTPFLQGCSIACIDNSSDMENGDRACLDIMS